MTETKSDPNKEASISAEIPYVLMKGGHFYAPESSGYVSRFELAGLYSEKRARAEERSCAEVRAYPVTEFARSPDALQGLIDRLEIMRDAAIAAKREESVES